MHPGRENRLLATGRSPAVADADTKQPGGPARAANQPQAPEASSDAAEREAIRRLAAPWQIRHRKLIIAGLALVAIVGLPALGAYAWRTWGPNPLEELKTVVPAQPGAEQED